MLALSPTWLMSLEEETTQRHTGRKGRKPRDDGGRCSRKPGSSTDCWPPPEVRRGHWTDPLLTAFRWNQHCRHLAFWLLVLHCERKHFCFFKPPRLWYFMKQWRTPFPIWYQSVVPCPVLTVASWPAYKFLKRQIRCSGIPISFRIFHSLLWSTQSKALA